MRADNTNEQFSTPINISDLLTVCKSFSKLGYQIQNQTELIMEIGIDEAVKSGAVSIAALPHIRDFLRQISQETIFGEACDQSLECIYLIDRFEDTHSHLFKIAN